MEFYGRIIELMDVRGGISQRGENWKEQSFVVENDGRYPVRICFSMFGTDKLEQFKSCLQLNAFVNVYFDISAKKSPNGRWFNDIQAYKLELTAKQPYLVNQDPQQNLNLTPQEETVLNELNSAEEEDEPF